ncbi:MAG: DUF423 domain-containing protein [Luteibaculaceae bacterium]
MKKNILLGAFISLGLATTLGALGAHAFKNMLTEHLLESFETAVRYQFYNSLVLLAVCGLKDKIIEAIRLPLNLIIWGACIFSFSIYLIVFFKHQGILWPIKFLGPITPVGGLLLVVGFFLAGFFLHSKIKSKGSEPPFRD